MWEWGWTKILSQGRICALVVTKVQSLWVSTLRKSIISRLGEVNFTHYSAIMWPHLDYSGVSAMEEVLGRPEGPNSKLWGWSVVSDKHWNCKTTTDILNPPKDTETTSKIRAVLSLYYSSYILSLYYSLFLSINCTSFTWIAH